MENYKLMHPSDVCKYLNCEPYLLEALANSTYLEKQHGWRKIDGKAADWWYLKSQVDKLKSLDYCALIGFHGKERFLIESEKWEKIVKTNLKYKHDSIGTD